MTILRSIPLPDVVTEAELFVLAYVQGADAMSFNDALALATDRDAEAARVFVASLPEEVIGG